MNMPITLRCLLLGLVLVATADVGAATRAWLDRDRVALGETATLNIETAGPASGAPDYSPLARDFTLGARSSRRQFTLDQGRATETMLYAIAVQPQREGLVAVPPLRVGSTRTPELTLTVTAAAPARAGGAVFIEAEADDARPYVQQALGYVVRLYYATQLVSGELDQPSPDGAAVQRVGSDLQFSREIAGRRYTVLERRYLLVPERSGTLVIPPARFVGRGVGGFFDEFFGDGQRALSATGPRRVLDVQPVPAGASQPWLPLHGLSLQVVDPPSAARAGSAVDVLLQADADGANATQLPALELAAGDDAQVFADTPQVEERFENGRPGVRITRRFSIVPARAGALRVEGPRLAWWDVGADAARTASIPALTIQVASAPRSSTTSPTAPVASIDDAGEGAARGVGEGMIRVPGVQDPVQPWALVAVVFALLWLATLMWALTRGERGGVVEARARVAADPGAARPQWSDRGFSRVLDTGGLDEVATLLCASAVPPAANLEAFAARLGDPEQRAAIADLQQAHWGGGDAAGARARLRAAFKGGPRWHKPDAAASEVLAPLYPRVRRPG